MKIITNRYSLLILLLSATVTLLSACNGDNQNTKAQEPPETSGFLKNYDSLQPMPGRPQTLYYEKSDVDWSKYAGVMIEPVKITTKGDDATGFRMSLRDRRMLGTYFEYTMRDAVGIQYPVVTKAGPGIIKVKAAITDVTSTSSVMSGFFSGPPHGFGNVSMEGELLDSVTNERLVAIVDGQAGTAFLEYESWDDVTHAFDKWAEQLYHLLQKNLGDVSPSRVAEIRRQEAQRVAANPALQAPKPAQHIVNPTPQPVQQVQQVQAQPQVMQKQVMSQPKPQPVPQMKKQTQTAMSEVEEVFDDTPAVVEQAVATPEPVVEQVVATPQAVEQVVATPQAVEQVVATPEPQAQPQPTAFDPWSGGVTNKVNWKAKKLRPFILAHTTNGDFNAVVEATKKRLSDAKFTLAGEYSPYPNTHIIVITDKKLQKVASKTKDGGYGANVRVSITQAGGKIQIAYNNPVYTQHIYRMKGSLAPVAKKLGKTLGSIKAFGSGDGISGSDLEDWHYMFGMPYFDDPIELGSAGSHSAMVSKIEKALASKKAGNSKVYKIALPGGKQTLFGVAVTQGSGADKTVMSAIDTKTEKHSAHLPYEILVSGDTAYILNGKFRIALSFPDLTMGEFMTIKSAPDDLESKLGALVK